MKQIKIIAEYPDDRAEEIFNALALGLGYKTENGDRDEFIQSKLNAQLESWLRASYHMGKRIEMGVPIEVQRRGNPRGLGDSLADFIHIFTNRIQRGFKWISMNCGCDSRRKWLNRHFPYKSSVERL